mgnify:CR=1 FL=1
MKLTRALLTPCQVFICGLAQTKPVTLKPSHPLNEGVTTNSALVANLRGRRTHPQPVWFMRQAGRSLPEYRALRANSEMLEACLDVDMVVEITLQPVRRHNVDAAIFFSDIVVPFRLAGIDVDIKAGIGPVIANPVRSAKQLAGLQLVADGGFAPIERAVERLVAELGATPLIAFGGAPFTLASYLIEGGPSRDFPNSRQMMREDPELWAGILNWCADLSAQFITAQVQSGASALQVFDSWAGRLTTTEYEQFAMPFTRRLFSQLDHLIDDEGELVPRLHFAVGSGQILERMLAVGATALGIDDQTSLADANRQFDGKVPLQGNISPDVLTAPWPEIEAHVLRVLEDGKDAPGHVVNLGHGVPKDTDPDVLTRIVALVHEVTSKQ